MPGVWPKPNVELDNSTVKHVGHRLQLPAGLSVQPEGCIGSFSGEIEIPPLIHRTEVRCATRRAGGSANRKRAAFRDVRLLLREVRGTPRCFAHSLLEPPRIPLLGVVPPK